MKLILGNTLLITGRYFLPFEDVVILVTGEDFDGVESSRAVAGGFILVELIPGASAVKALKLIKYGDEVLQVANVVVKYADNVYKTQKALVKDVLEGITPLIDNTMKGNFGEIVIDVDLYEKGYGFLNRADGVDYPGEKGQIFEILVYGENVTSSNAALILKGN